MKVNINIKLIEDCVAKNRPSQKEFYDILFPYLQFICRRYLYDKSYLKDVMQISFVKIFQNMHQFTSEKASIKTWSTKIAINECLKKNSSSKIKLEPFILGLHDIHIDPKVIDNLTKEEILIWLKRMPVQYFEVYNLYIIDGFTHAEISEILNITNSLSRKRLSRGKDWIRKNLDKNFENLVISKSKI